MQNIRLYTSVAELSKVYDTLSYETLRSYRARGKLHVIYTPDRLRGYIVHPDDVHLIRFNLLFDDKKIESK